MYNRTCATCGVDFIAQRSWGRFCGRRCANVDVHRREATKVGLLPCKACGIEFQPRLARQVYCTTECHYEGKRRRYGGDRQCRYCRAWVNKATAWCSTGCRRRAEAIVRLERAAAGVEGRRWTAGPCAECGKSFVVDRLDSQVRVCSARCRGRRTRRARVAKYGHNADSPRKRTRASGAAYEPVDRVRVFERDRWRCGLCGKAVRRSAKVPHPLLSNDRSHRAVVARRGPRLRQCPDCALSVQQHQEQRPHPHRRATPARGMRVPGWGTNPN